MKQLSLSEIKEIELDILIAFDKYCRENDLTYFLCGGTLLGAIRHNGFIPWDDDIDVFMPRPDYEKLMILTQSKPISSNFRLASYSNKNCFTPTPFYKVFDDRTFVVQHYSKIPLKIWVDIFAIDGLPDEQKKINKIYKKLSFYKTILGICTSDFTYKQKLYKKIIKYILKPFVHMIGLKNICKRMDRNTVSIKYENSNIVGVKHWGYGPNEAMKKDELLPVEHVFEGKKFFIPANYHKYLTNLYGDYMQLPPEEQRICHGIKAYKLD